MGEQDINRPERLSRWILKSLKPGVEIQTGEVHRLVAEVNHRRSHVSPAWRQQVRLEVQDVPQAVQLALSNGWLAEWDGRLRLTESGASLARRSRAGPRRKRVTF